MNDIGFAKFSINKDMSRLDVDWVYRVGENEFVGSGFGEGLISESFDGTYRVTYLNAKGDAMFKYDLAIIPTEGYYLLNWTEGEKLLYTGVGKKYDGILYVGWQKYQN